MKERNNKKILLGLLLISGGLLIPWIKIQKEMKEEESKEKRIAYYKEVTGALKKEENVVIQSNGDNYIAVLEIPDLEIKNGLVNKYSKYNDVKYNVMILDGSSMPDVKNSNLILAGHNGTSKVSYFNNLDKIKDNTLIYIYYNGIKYTYRYDNSYEVFKTGSAVIKRNRDVNTLTLITCKNNDDIKQVVYIAYLINKEVY